MISIVVLYPHRALRVHHAAPELLKRHHRRLINFLHKRFVVVVFEQITQIFLRELNYALAQLDVLEMLFEEKPAKRNESQHACQRFISGKSLTLTLQLFRTFSCEAVPVGCTRGLSAARGSGSSRPKKRVATSGRAPPRALCSSSSLNGRDD